MEWMHILLSLSIFGSILSPALATPLKATIGSSPSIVNSSLSTSAIGSHFENSTLGYPALPYDLKLRTSGDTMTIYRVVPMSNRLRETIDVLDVRRFIQEFADNIRREYLTEGYIPRSATDWTVDPVSYTTWRVSVGDGLFGRRMTTIAALEALSKLEAQLMRYGPASVSFVVGTGSWAFYGRGGITFEKLQGDSTTKFVASEKL